MEKVRRWIPFVFSEICLSDEKCGYEVVYWESFAEIKKRQFVVSDLERKGVLSLCSMLSGIKKTPQDAALFEGQSLDYAASSRCSSSTASSFFAFFGAGLRFAPIA